MEKSNSKNSISYRTAIKIFRTMDELQLEKFEIFLRSEFFNISQDVQIIFQCIKENLPDPLFIGFEKKALNLLFSKKNNGKKVTPKLTLQLNDAIERFLIIHQLNQEDFYQKHFLQKSYVNQGLIDLFKKTSKKISTKLSENKTYDHSFHLKNFLIHESVYFHSSTEKNATSIDSLEKMIESLYAFYCMSRLRIGIEMSLRKNFIEENKELPGLEEALNFAHASESQHFQFYALLLELIQETESFQEGKFESIKNIFFEKIKLWKLSDQKNILQFLINYVTSFLNKGNKEIFPIQLDLFKFGLTRKLLFNENNLMSYSSFSNVLSTFLACKNFDEANIFVSNYKKHLEQAIRKDAARFSEGYIAMIKNDFTTAIQKLMLVSQKTDIFKLQVVCFLLRASFEQYLIEDNYKTLLDSSLRRFKNYFKKNNVIAKERAIGFFNLSKTINDFFQILENTPIKKQRTLKLKALLTALENETDPIMMKPWLTQKLQQELKRRK